MPYTMQSLFPLNRNTEERNFFHPKCGYPSDPNNYRPITLTSAISKYFEEVISDPFLESKVY